MDDGVPSLRSPWRTYSIIGGVAGAIPFFVHVSSSSSTTVNGQVTSFVYRDWVAVGCGVVAVLFGLVTLVAARKEELQRSLAFAAGAGVLLLGGLQIARGFGVFEQPETRPETSMPTTMQMEPPPVVPKPAPDPTTCSEPEACIEAGKTFLYRDPPEPDKAIPLLVKACDANNAAGCMELGRAYATSGPTKDMAKAEVVLKKSCDAENVDGCYFLGLFYDQGLGGNQDLKQARVLFEKACTKGSIADGCFFLGEMRRRAIGGDADAPGALAAYTDGCKAGNQKACDAAKALEASPPPKKKKGSR